MRPPSVDSLANSLLDIGLPQPLCVDIAREAIKAGDPDSARDRAERRIRAMLQPVVNATGVLLHTNLGRAPIQFDDGEFMLGSEPSYMNLELDLNTGQRGSRQDNIGALFARLSGAESALIVNNCSAAITLILAALAGAGSGDQANENKGVDGGIDGGAGAVIVSRGELVEIGGGFRVPEVIAQSGAKLVEVGTTNRTRLKDYERAVKKYSARLCLKVHQSNYTQKGFTQSVDVSALTTLGVPVVADIGSGLLDSACPWLEEGPPGWLEGEPAAKQYLEVGVKLVAFSGDKLLGGPQAGIIAGDADLIETCARHPLARAFRPGNLTISALEDVALKYLKRQGNKIPFWKIATENTSELQSRAEAVLATVQEIANQGSPAEGADVLKQNQVSIGECSSVPGGGTLPEVQIPSIGIFLKGDLTERLRELEVPIIARVQEDRTVLDLRTVFPTQDRTVAKGLATVLATAP